MKLNVNTVCPTPTFNIFRHVRTLLNQTFDDTCPEFSASIIFLWRTRGSTLVDRHGINKKRYCLLRNRPRPPPICSRVICRRRKENYCNVYLRTEFIPCSGSKSNLNFQGGVELWTRSHAVSTRNKTRNQ